MELPSQRLRPALRRSPQAAMTRTPLRLDEAAKELVSDRAGLAYPIRDGVPILLIEEAREFTPIDDR